MYAPEPQFSKEARAKKIGGAVLVRCDVGIDGLPKNVRVVRGLGHGLDEKAVEAVSQYRFRPAIKNGHPVAVEIHISVNFQVF
jgi:protein TonB